MHIKAAWIACVLAIALTVAMGAAEAAEYAVRSVPVGPFSYVTGLAWIDEDRVIFGASLREPGGEITSAIWIARVRPTASGDVAVVKVSTTYDQICDDTIRGFGYAWNADEAKEFTVDGLTMKFGDTQDRKSFSLEPARRLMCRPWQKSPEAPLDVFSYPLLDGDGRVFTDARSKRVWIVTLSGTEITLEGISSDGFSTQALSWSKPLLSYYTWDERQQRSAKLRVRQWDEKTKSWAERYDSWQTGACRAFSLFTPAGATSTICVPYIENGQSMTYARGTIYMSTLFGKGEIGRVLALRAPHKEYEPVATDCLSDRSLFPSPDENAVLYLSGAAALAAPGSPCGKDTLALRIIERAP